MHIKQYKCMYKSFEISFIRILNIFPSIQLGGGSKSHKTFLANNLKTVIEK